MGCLPELATFPFVNVLWCVCARPLFLDSLQHHHVLFSARTRKSKSPSVHRRSSHRLRDQFTPAGAPVVRKAQPYGSVSGVPLAGTAAVPSAWGVLANMLGCQVFLLMPPCFRARSCSAPLHRPDVVTACPLAALVGAVRSPWMWRQAHKYMHTYTRTCMNARPLSFVPTSTCTQTQTSDCHSSSGCRVLGRARPTCAQAMGIWAGL